MAEQENRKLAGPSNLRKVTSSEQRQSAPGVGSLGQRVLEKGTSAPFRNSEDGSTHLKQHKLLSFFTVERWPLTID